MIRTKHAVVTVSLLAALFVVLLGDTVSESFGGVTLLGASQPALLIASTDTEPQVVIARDTTREDARAALIAALKDVSFPEDDTQTPPPEPESDPGSTAAADVPAAPPSLLCNPHVTVASYADWGSVNVLTGEGARVVRTLETLPDGAPLHAVQLPLTPLVTGMTSCLPNSMIAVLLDGTTVVPNEPVSTDREGIVGYAIDGFPLFGTYENGTTVSNADLDVCHGHEHTIVDQGIPVTRYHYHVTDEEPYTLGCFRGTPVLTP